MSAATTAGAKPYYFVPQPSHWPIIGSIALFLMGSAPRSGSTATRPGRGSVAAGFVVLRLHDVRLVRHGDPRIRGRHLQQEGRLSFRWGMSWFIFSEVMFFAAFFGALFYIRVLSVPDLGDLESASSLWPDYAAHWPTDGPYIDEQFTPMGAMGIPLLNTIILLTSGVTLTIAHHALKAGNRGALKLWLFLTIVLGFMFLGFQAYEYIHAYSELNLKLLDRRLRLDVLHADRLPRPARDDRRDHADGDAGPRASRATSRPSTTSRSRPPRGTGTSSTWSGCCCSCWCTGSDCDAPATGGDTRESAWARRTSRCGVWYGPAARYAARDRRRSASSISRDARDASVGYSEPAGDPARCNSDDERSEQRDRQRDADREHFTMHDLPWSRYRNTSADQRKRIRPIRTKTTMRMTAAQRTTSSRSARCACPMRARWRFRPRSC